MLVFPAGRYLCPRLRTDTVTMKQEEHLTEESTPLKFFTRSTARHLRRKRLHDARRTEKEQEHPTQDLNVNSTQISIIEKDSNYFEVLSKSKTRRLRKRNKAQLLQNCCSFCESHCKSSSPIIEAVNNQEVITEKDTEDIRTITKSKARRLRKKNKTKLVQSTCSFCYETYPSAIDPILLKYVQTNEYDPNCCSNLESGIANNIERNHSADSIVEADICHVQYDKTAERTEEKPGNIESQKKWSELSCLPRSLGSLQFENEEQTYEIKYDETAEDLVFASQLKQKILETIETRINCTKEEPIFQRSDGKQFNELESLSNLQGLVNPTNLERLDYIAGRCNIGSEKEEKFGAETITTTTNENVSSYLDNNLGEEAEITLFSETNIESATLPAANELLKNAKNIEFSDPSEVNTFTNSVADNTELTLKENITSASCNKIQSKAVPVSSSSRINQNYSSDSHCSQNENKRSTESDRPASATTKMANKGNASEKSREEIKAEREAKKAAKASARVKAKITKPSEKDGSNCESVPPDNIQNKPTREKVENATTENIEPPNKTPVVNIPANTCVKDTAPEVSSEGKSKAELRAERRARQEAQRAAKQQNLEKTKVKSIEESVSNKPAAQSTGVMEIKRATMPKKIVQKDNAHEINLFKHLYHEREQAVMDVPFVNSNIHPGIVRLGIQYASKMIVGSNARCVALLAAVKQLIKDFERPSQADFIRGLEASLQESIAYLHHCRPLAVSMQNALRHLKWQMTQLPSALPDADAKNKLGSAIDTYILEQIQLADKAISITIQTKISNGDVILTYGYSSLIHKILLDAHTAGKQFRVIVVDGRPWLEGKEQLRRLAKHGIECSYILINALSYVMPEVSKVFLGAHAILANGAVMSRVGTAQVALMARAFNIPVLVACETHKSCERVQTDSIVYNELGNADDLAQDYGTDGNKSLLVNWKTRKSLNLLNITYDVTPADLVTAVVTELAILPCTSVPVILRIKPSEI